ncbi:MAG: beta strand repeat-containing protein [Alphaproteobacteria bacterium]
MNVSASAANQTGGTAVVAGGAVAVASTTRIDARGPAGGGTVKIGGGARGADASVRNALNTTIATGAVIDASATNSGNGGTVAVWSDGNTVFNGAIRARGGPNGGNGGWVETSGHRLSIGPTAAVDALAPNGKVGDWVLDPNSIIVRTGGACGGAITDAACLAALADARDTESNLVVDPSVINNAAANVTMQAVDFVSFQSPVDMVNNGVALNVRAGGAVTVDASLTTNNGDFTVRGFGGAASFAGSFSSTAPINTGTGFVTINAGPITIGSSITSSKPQSQYGIFLHSTGAITETASGSLNVASLRAITQSEGEAPIILDNPANSVSGFVTLSTLNSDGAARAPGAITFFNSTGYTITAVSGFGIGDLETGIATAGTATLQASGPIRQFTGSNGAINAQNLVVRTQSNTGADILLGTANNTVPGNVTLTALDAAGTALAPGAIDFFSTTGFTIASLGGLQTGVATTDDAALVSQGAVAEAAGAAITADSLSVTLVGGATLTGANNVATLFASNGNSGLFSFTNDGPLAVSFASSAGDLALTTTGGIGSTLTLDGNVTGDAVRLISAGPISQTAGVITATTLTGSAGGAAELAQSNRITTLDGFSTTTGGANGDFTLRNGLDLLVSSPVSTGSGTLTLDTGSAGLTLAAPFSTLPGGALRSTGTINLTADSMALNAQIGGDPLLGIFGAAQVNIAPFSPDQPINLGTGATTGLALDSSELSNIRAAAVSIGSSSAGPLTFGAFTVANLGVPTSLTFTTGSTATFNGPIVWDAQTAGTINAAGDIRINSPITATNSGSVLTLNAEGTISQSALGTITIATLTGTSTGGTTLTADNSVDTLGSFINNGDGSFQFRNNKSLTVLGPISGGSGVSSTGELATSVLIETTGAASTLTIAGPIQGNDSDAFDKAYSVRLHATGPITETSTGSISAGSLLARTQNDVGAAITLDNPANAIPGSVTLSTLNANGTDRAPGAITFFDSTGFVIGGVVAGGIGGIERGITTAGTATLEAGGNIENIELGRLTRAGRINAQNLVVRTKNDQGGYIRLIHIDNQVPGNVTLTALNAAGTALAPGEIEFFNTSGFTIASLGGLHTGVATTDAVTLTSQGAITEAADAAITASSLSVTSVGGATLTGANKVATLSASNGNSGLFSFTNEDPLAVSFASSAGDLTLTTTGGTGSTLTLDGDVTGNLVTLTSAGPISQTAGVITAATLTGSAAGAADLAQSNRITTLDGFSTTTGGANGNFTLRNGLDLLVGSSVSTGSGTLTLDTGSSGLTLGGALRSTGTINLTADSMALNAQVGGSTVVVQRADQVNIFPSSPNQPISLGGTGTATGLALNASELSRIRAREVSVGNSSAGPLTFDAFTVPNLGVPALLTFTTGSTATFNGPIVWDAPTTGTINAAGNIRINSPIIASDPASVLALNAGGTISQSAAGTITIATLTGTSVGGTTLTAANGIDTLGTFTNTLSGSLTIVNNRSLTTTGTLSSPENVTLTTTTGGLTVDSDIAATSGDVTLTAAGPLSLTGPINVSAGNDILLTSGAGEESSGGVTLSGLIAMKAGEPEIVIAADGSFQQSGTLDVVAADYVLIDTTGRTAQRRLEDLMQAIAAAGVQNDPDPVVITNSLFDPVGATANAITFNGTLNAEDSVVLLIANQGPITGGSSDNLTINVGELGISGRGSQAQLFGSIGGNEGEAAAAAARINPLTDPDYLFNSCIIGSAVCGPLPPPPPPPPPPEVINPQLVIEAGILAAAASDTAEALLRPQPASEVDILVTRPGGEDDPDTPLVNIFDEERLCELLLRTNPELAREVCR